MNKYNDFDDLDFEIEKLFNGLSKNRKCRRGRRNLIKCDYCGYSFEPPKIQKYDVICPTCGNMIDD